MRTGFLADKCLGYLYFLGMMGLYHPKHAIFGMPTYTMVIANKLLIFGICRKFLKIIFFILYVELLWCTFLFAKRRSMIFFSICN